MASVIWLTMQPTSWGYDLWPGNIVGLLDELRQSYQDCLLPPYKLIIMEMWQSSRPASFSASGSEPLAELFTALAHDSEWVINPGSNTNCCHIFPWLCVWDGCTTIFCHLLHIYLENTGTLFQLFVFSLLMFSLWYLRTIRYIMVCRSCSFVCRLHHVIIIIMQTHLKALN